MMGIVEEAARALEADRKEKAEAHLLWLERTRQGKHSLLTTVVHSAFGQWSESYSIIWQDEVEPIAHIDDLYFMAEQTQNGFRNLWLVHPCPDCGHYVRCVITNSIVRLGEALEKNYDLDATARRGCPQAHEGSEQDD